MYVCMCFAVTDRQIREAAQNGKPFRYLRDTYQMGTQCGICMKTAKEEYDKHAVKPCSKQRSGCASCACNKSRSPE